MRNSCADETSRRDFLKSSTGSGRRSRGDADVGARQGGSAQGPGTGNRTPSSRACKDGAASC